MNDEAMAGGDEGWWSRRDVLATFGLGLLGLAAGCKERPSLPPERRQLDALAEVMLPSVLTLAERSAVVDDHLVWVRGYEPGRRRRKGPPPQRFAPAHYRDDLERLDRDARAAHGRAFAALPLADRVQLVETTLTPEMPVQADSPHVAWALLWRWYESPGGHNHCVGARVDPHTPRPLTGSVVPPKAWP
jgi:hypothetical protein